MAGFFLMVLAAVLSFGCASTGPRTSGYGTLVESAQVRADFEKYIIRPNYTYYYSGADDYPNAVIGVDNRYALVSELWKKVDLTPAKLKDWVDDLIAVSVIPSAGMLHGYDIVNESGAILGIWYSVIYATPRIAVRMKGDNQFDLDTPPVDLYTTGGFGGPSIQIPTNR